jgi:prolyl oligopeptidase
LTAEEIHNIGIKEVERIRGEMEKLKDQIGFKGTIDEFNTFLKNDSQFYYKDKKDLMDGFRKILSKMDSKLPELFGKLPEAKYDLFEMEEFRAKSAPAAYYYSAPLDRSRPGYFYVNTYNLSARPKYTMTALALHEAVPGHHLQISIAQELRNLPKFRRELGVTAFVEGWGLYAEYLGYETEMYEDLYQKYGALTFEMWRACRLVVDTGIHEKHWSREQAYDFIKKYTPTSDHDLKSEIDRYISWPGQALAYKIGEMKIKELRKSAESRLGPQFDVKEFHDNVLKNGPLPLNLLDEKIDEWIKSKN